MINIITHYICIKKTFSRKKNCHQKIFLSFFLCNDKKVHTDRYKFTQLGVFDFPVVPMPMNPFLERESGLERERVVILPSPELAVAGEAPARFPGIFIGLIPDTISPTDHRQNLTGVSSAPASQEN